MQVLAVMWINVSSSGQSVSTVQVFKQNINCLVKAERFEFNKFMWAIPKKLFLKKSGPFYYINADFNFMCECLVSLFRSMVLLQLKVYGALFQTLDFGLERTGVLVEMVTGSH